jgi:predicted metal-dependent HD superfamily phosphohydrolase
MAEPDIDALRRSWTGRALLYGAHGSVVDKLFGTLVNAYAEPGRYYHTLDHVSALLRDIERFASPANDRAALTFAAWFHDAIYDTHRTDNEARSAGMAANILRGLMAPEALVGRVSTLVLATAMHDPDPADPDAVLFIDCDLAILGVPADAYALYSAAVRAEYAWVDPDVYRRGRRAVLERMLGRERIYRTPEIFTAREARARENIASELAALG